MALSEREKLELEREKLQLEIELEEEQQSLSKGTPAIPYKKENNPLVTAIHKGASGVTGGHSDEIYGAVAGAGDYLKDTFTGENKGKGFTDYYAENRDKERAFLDRAQEEYPGMSLASEIGGGIASLPSTGSVKGAAMLGAFLGEGYSKGNLSSVDKAKELGQDTAASALLSGGMTGLSNFVSKYGIDVLNKVSPKIAEAFKKLSGKLEQNATGATASQVEKFKPGTEGELIKRGVVKFGSSQRDIEQEAAKQMGQAGRIMGDVLKQVEKSGKKIDPQSIISKLDDEIALLAKDPSQAKTVAQLRNIQDDVINAWTEGGGGSLSPMAVEETKRGYQALARKSYTDPDRQLATKAAARIHKEAVEDVTSDLSPELLEQFTEAKKTYGLLDPVQEAAERRANVTQQSPLGGFGDLVLGGATYGFSDSPEAALGTVLARRLVHPRLASSGAVLSNMASNATGKAPQMAELGIRAAKKAIAPVSQGIINSTKQPDDIQNMDLNGLGKFSSVLSQAKQESPEKLAQAHYVLYRGDPEYQKLYNENKKQEGE